MGEEAAVLGTERLELRPVATGDLAVLHELFVDPDVRRFLFDGEALSQDAVAEMIAESEASFRESGFGAWLLRLEDEPVGCCALRRMPEGEVELIYALSPAHWGRGLATEASQAVLAHGFATGLDRVIAQADVPNRASLYVMERLGMRFEREFVKDGLALVQYAISREGFAESDRD